MLESSRKLHLQSLLKNLDARPSTGAEHLRVGEMQGHVVDRIQEERGGTEGTIPLWEVESSTVIRDKVQSPPVELQAAGKKSVPSKKRGFIIKT